LINSTVNIFVDLEEFSEYGEEVSLECKPWLYYGIWEVKPGLVVSTSWTCYAMTML